MSSPELEPSQLAAILAQKATDEAVAVPEIEDNSRIADSILGFHAQQAIEMWLNAVLAANSVAFEYTHDLRHLIGLVEAAGLPFPLDIPQVVMSQPISNRKNRRLALARAKPWVDTRLILSCLL